MTSAGSLAPGMPNWLAPSAQTPPLAPPPFTTCASSTVSSPVATPFFPASALTQRAQPLAPLEMAMLATEVPCSQPLIPASQTVFMGAPWGRWKTTPAKEGWSSWILSSTMARSTPRFTSAAPRPPVCPAAQNAGAPTAAVLVSIPSGRASGADSMRRTSGRDPIAATAGSGSTAVTVLSSTSRSTTWPPSCPIRATRPACDSSVSETAGWSSARACSRSVCWRCAIRAPSPPSRSAPSSPRVSRPPRAKRRWGWSAAVTAGWSRRPMSTLASLDGVDAVLAEAPKT